MINHDPQESRKRDRIPSQEIEDSNMGNDRISVNPKRQKKEQRGKLVTEEEEVELFKICKRHEKSYGRKGEKEGMAYFWNLVVSDFIDYRGNIPYSAKSCQRRVTSKLMQRKLELQMEGIGGKKRYSDWTVAVDAWREVVQVYEATEKEKKNQGFRVDKKSVLTDQEEDIFDKERGQERKRGNSATMMSEEIDWEEENNTRSDIDRYENSVDQLSDTIQIISTTYYYSNPSQEIQKNKKI